MLKVRLQRIGRRNNPSYRVVVSESRFAANKGKIVEFLGSHDTIRKNTTLNKDRILYWISQGAQVSGTVHNLLVSNAIIEGTKKNVLPKKSVQEKQKGEESETKTEEDIQHSSDTDTTVDEAQNTTAGREKQENAQVLDEEKQEQSEQEVTEPKQEVVEPEQEVTEPEKKIKNPSDKT